MWSDNDIDNAFRRLDPAEPEPTPFPLDAWLKLEAGLDQAVIDRAVRRRLWQFFAAEVLAVALVGLGWWLWPTGTPAAVASAPERVSETRLQAACTASKRVHGLQAAKTAAQSALPGQPAVGETAPAPATAAEAPASPVTTAPLAAVVTTTPAGLPAMAERRRHLPLALVPAPTQREASSRTTRAEAGRVSTIGMMARRSTVRPAARHIDAGLLGGPSVAFTTKALPNAVPYSANEPNSLKSAANSSGKMAVSSEAASGVAVADAASHGLKTPAGTPVGQCPVVAIEDAAGTMTVDETATPASLNPAAVGRLAPLGTLVAALSRPAAARLPATLRPVASAETPLPAVVRQPRLYVGVAVAPDVSTVEFANVQAPRLNVGLTLEYRLGQRWRVATGVQRSTKEYYARREDYNWTNYPRAQTRDFSWVEGRCTVLDVPLNLRYDAVVRGQGRWFGTAGLSSFFMQRENYSYDYEESGTSKNWELPGLVNANRHLFSVLNLSAGYEYGLSTRWRLQAEPYVKVPLAGVGAGKVKLLSAGVFFGLKYGF